MAVALLSLVACTTTAEPCADGFERGADLNCYPIPVPTTTTTDTIPTTPTTETLPTTPEAVRYDGPVFVETATVRCTLDDNAFVLSARTRGWAWRANIVLFGTGLVNPIAEEHDLFSVDADENGWWDALAVGPLIAETPPSLAVRNVHTVLSCYDLEAGFLSYAIRVYDLDDQLVDCITWGHDDALVRDGGAPTDGVSDPLDFSGCFDFDGAEL